MSTPARKAQLIGDLREQRDSLYLALESASGLDANRAGFERDRRRSSLHEELIRLADAEVTYRAWIECACAANSADVRSDEARRADLDISSAASYSLSDIADVMALERRETLAQIRELDPSDFLRQVQTRDGALTVDDLVAALARHDREMSNAILRRDGTLLPRYYARSRSPGAERG